MTLADFTKPERIIPELQSREPDEVVAELAATLELQGKPAFTVRFCEAVIKHEEVSATVFSPGLALPHARVNGMLSLSLAVGRTSVPIQWFNGATGPVQMIFLFAVPENQAQDYLDVISAVARMSEDPMCFPALVQARDRQGILEILQKVELRSGRRSSPQK
jgi:mannitol/fructose-specific phosphotransferase system IIA component (Ntr-type)